MSLGGAFAEHLRDLFAGVGAFSIKPMFGGAGLYCGETIFAIAVDGAVYIKADATSKGRFEEAGQAPFAYDAKDGRRVSVSYWRMPDAALDDPDEAMDWARLGLEAARRAPPKKPAKKRPRG